MSTELDNGYSSDLEVVSKAMADLEDSIDSKFASPDDSPDLKQSSDPLTMEAVEMDANNKPSDVKLDTSMVNGNGHGGSIDAAMNGTTTNSTISPEEASADPMLASALLSPLHDPLQVDAMFSPTKPMLQRAPSILQRAHSVGNDWELYKRAGPKYPASLDHLVMKYHQKHSNSWQLAHDFGAGSGVYSPTLARFFRHVHVSDPTTSGIATSRKLLSQWSKENAKKRGRLTFSTCKPEQAEECVAEASVDMAVMTESAHFTDAEAMIRSVANTLAPGGTLMIITHRPVSKVVGNPQVGEAVDALFEAWGRRPWEVACGTEAKSQQLFSLGLDFVPLPEDLFKREETRRITINAHGKPREYFRVPGADSVENVSHMSTDEMLEMPMSRVDEKEKRLSYGIEDEQSRGWQMEVGWESFRTRIAVLDSPEVVNKLEPELNEVKERIMKTSPNGVKVVVEWAVAIVLATRKSAGCGGDDFDCGN